MSDQQMQGPKSYMVIRFSDVGSVLFSLQSEGVTPMQMLALAEYISLKAKDMIMREEHTKEEEHEQTAISKPTSKLIVPGRG